MACIWGAMQKCGKLNHFTSECRQTSATRGPKGRTTVRQLGYESDSNSDELDIMVISNSMRKIENKIFANMLLIDQQKQVQFQLDSGAMANLISRKFVPTKNLKSNHSFKM